MIQGKFEVSTLPLRTGPATPKQAASGCTPCNSMNLTKIKTRTTTAPARFNQSCALEKGGITDHAIVQQTLVTGIGLLPEVVGVGEVHVHGAQSHDWTRDFRGET